MCGRITCLLAVWLAATSLVAEEGDTLWRFDTLGEVFGAPARDQSGNLYFGNREGKVISLDQDGEFRWEFAAGDWVDSSPTLSADESVVYFGSWDNFLYAVATEDGELLWSFETGNLVVASPALDAEGNLYFGSSDGFFYSLDASGSLRWFELVGEELDSSPAVTQDGSVYVGSYDGVLYSFSYDGDLNWSFETLGVAEEAQFRVKAPPSVSYTGEVYFGGGDGRLYALSGEGELQWTFEANEAIDTGVAIREDGALVFGSRDGFLYCVDQDGVLEWSSYVGDVFYSTPAVDGFGRSYVGAYIGNGVSGVTALSADGEVVWDHLVLDYIDSSPLLDGEGALYYGCYDGSFYAVECLAAPALSDWPRFGADSGNRGQQAGSDGGGFLSSGFELWADAFALFGEARDPAADEDGDGIQLLAEYWFGGDPWAFDSQLVFWEREGELLEFRYNRLLEEGELGEVWEFRADGGSWQVTGESGAPLLEFEQVAADAFGDGKYETVRGQVSFDGFEGVLFRIRMTGLE